MPPKPIKRSMTSANPQTRQQGTGVGGDGQRQRDCMNRHRIVSKGVPALMTVIKGSDGIAACEDVINGIRAGSGVVADHHRWRPPRVGVDYKWPRPWDSAT